MPISFDRNVLTESLTEAFSFWHLIVNLGRGLGAEAWLGTQSFPNLGLATGTGPG